MTSTRRTSSRSAGRGYTLMELAVASAVSTLIVGALGSAVVLAAGSLPAAATGSGGLLEASDALSQIAGDLEQGAYVTRPSAAEARIVLRDRDGDGAPEVVEYAWSSTDGEPVTRTDDFGDPRDVLGDVGRFAVSLTTADSTETYVGAKVIQTQEIDSLKWSSGYTQSLSIQSGFVYANRIQPDLPANCLGWRPSRVTLYGRQGGLGAEVMTMQIRTRNEDGTPSETVLTGIDVREGDIPAYQGWYSCDWGDADWIDPATDACLLIGESTGSGGKVCTNLAEAKSDAGMWSSSVHNDYLSKGTGGPPTWAYLTNYEMYFSLDADCLVQEADGTVTWRRVVMGRVGAESSGATLERSARVVNAPLDVAAFWDADFASDPTALDLNADGLNDWVTSDAKVFDTVDLLGGLYRHKQDLIAQPATDLTTPTIVEIDWSQTEKGPEVGTLVVAADQGGGRQAILTLRVGRPTDTAQTLTLSYTDDGGSEVELVSHEVASLELLSTRLLILPGVDRVNLRVDGSEVGTYVYSRRAYSDAERRITLIHDGDGVRIDRVRVLTGAGS